MKGFRICDRKKKFIVTHREVVLNNKLEPVWGTGSRRRLDLNRFSLEYISDIKTEDGEFIGENDIVIGDCYPFFMNAIEKATRHLQEPNYVGVVGKDDRGFYVNFRKVSERVRGGACGDCLDDIRIPLRKIGHAILTPEVLEIDSKVEPLSSDIDKEKLARTFEGSARRSKARAQLITKQVRSMIGEDGKI